MSITPERLRERAAILDGALEQMRGPEMEATRPERAYVDGAAAAGGPGGRAGGRGRYTRAP